MEYNKDKNDFSNYERCLKNDKQAHNSNNNNIIDMPILLVSIIDGTFKYKNSKKNTFFEKYYFVVTNCLPQGYYNISGEYERNYLC